MHYNPIADLAKILIMLAMIFVFSTAFVRWIDSSITESERQAQEWRETHQPVFEKP